METHTHYFTTFQVLWNLFRKQPVHSFRRLVRHGESNRTSEIYLIVANYSSLTNTKLSDGLSLGEIHLVSIFSTVWIFLWNVQPIIMDPFDNFSTRWNFCSKYISWKIFYSCNITVRDVVPHRYYTTTPNPLARRCYVLSQLVSLYTKSIVDIY